MKTALTEFIEYLESIQERDKIPSWVITTGKNHLQSEKQQIKEAYYAGDSDVWDNNRREAEQYYNETYGK